MLVNIIVPEKTMPKKDTEHPCACQFREFTIGEKTGEELYWLVEIGEHVVAGQVICEGEIEKKTLEFTAPCSGIIKEKYILDEQEFRRGDILGTMEED